MMDELIARIRQGHRTIPFPPADPKLSDRYRGRPVIDRSKCPADCHVCEESCPVQALEKSERGLCIDLGRCLFCSDCATVCPQKAIQFTQDYRLSMRKREDLITESDTLKLAEALDKEARRLFGRSLKLRQVSAGGCNACEADTNVLNTLVFDLNRFGIQFVASPRHADGLLVTGPIPENMRLALKKTYDAVPSPRLVIAVGACAISGGPYRDHHEAHNGIGDLLPVDLYVPGCPPHPFTILDGLLRLLGRVK
jgi:Ni,Fe-hydrogenase III small subunit/Pyruvate/2-oxoacid:ferredoxin oxidoreductase delta subunit